MLDVIHDELQQQCCVDQLSGDDVVRDVVVDARVLLDVAAGGGLREKNKRKGHDVVCEKGRRERGEGAQRNDPEAALENTRNKERGDVIGHDRVDRLANT